jgi:hypothetical protein
VQPQVFGTNLSPAQFKTQPGIDVVTSTLASRLLGTGLNSQPNATPVKTELSSLIGKLCMTNDCTTSKGTYAVAAAACATAFGSAEMLIN